MNTTHIKPRWIINDPIYGKATIHPASIRYYRDCKHPYGWELGFKAKITLENGTQTRRTYGALGTTRRAAMAHALSR